jgi:hypothetical protein
MRYRQVGFSIVEMVVVGAIVGTILAIAAPAIRSGHLGVSAPEATAVREMQLAVRLRRNIGRNSANTLLRWASWDCRLLRLTVISSRWLGHALGTRYSRRREFICWTAGERFT